MSDITKKYKRNYFILRGLSITATLGPLVVFALIAFANATVVQKLTLGGTLAVVAILTMISVLAKHHLRSPIFLLLLALYAALGNIMLPLVVLTIAVVLDEFIFDPAAKHYYKLFTINKEIDKRGI